MALPMAQTQRKNKLKQLLKNLHTASRHLKTASAAASMQGHRRLMSLSAALPIASMQGHKAWTSFLNGQVRQVQSASMQTQKAVMH
mmetsp:Transcript_45066/g.107087  ORF Transcript_45066/g.107087 Transcript_45066/m.107087 type:complete len:86 (-) Transcript_45066:572-829(-)